MKEILLRSDYVHRQKDMRSKSVKKIIALGDSITWGFCASKKERCWVNLVVSMIEEYQESKVELINQGIAANILTTLSPAYKYSSKPSGIERIESHVIDLNPDLVFLAYGLNDSRGGTSPDNFRKEYEKLLIRLQKKTDAIIVMLNTYYMHETFYSNCENWDKSNYNISEEYNLIIQQLATKYHAIYADIYASQFGVDWTVDADHCHPNDLGHRIIANKVFEAITRNCSFLIPNSNAPSVGIAFDEKYGGGPDLL